MSAYAYQCAGCEHLSSGHLLVDDGDLRAGPYRCGSCECEIPQDGPHIPLSRREYAALFGPDSQGRDE